MALCAAAFAPEAAWSAGSYDMRAMMSQPYPLVIQPPAQMFGAQRVPQAGAQAAPAPVRPAARYVPPPTDPAYDPYTPATAWPGMTGRPAPRPAARQPVYVSGSAPQAAPAAVESEPGFWDKYGTSGSYWDDFGDGGVWKFAFLNEDRGLLDGAMGNSHSGHLTWGWRIGYTPDSDNPGWFNDLRNWVGWPGNDWHAKASYGLEQIAYTPNSINADNGFVDRPYAGALLFTTRVNLSKPFDGGLQQNDFLELGAGLVGDASGAEVLHRVVHSAIDRSTRGWRGDVVKNEPVVVVQYEKGLRAVYGWDKWFQAELFPYVGAAVGNLYTYGAAGASVRFGNHLKRDAGPPRPRYLMEGENFAQKGKYWVWNVFAGFEQKAVGWNIFTDGNTYSDTSSVSTKPFPYEFTTGAELGYGAYRMTLTHVYRTEEFEEQDGQDRFIRLGVSASF